MEKKQIEVTCECPRLHLWALKKTSIASSTQFAKLSGASRWTILMTIVWFLQHRTLRYGGLESRPKVAKSNDSVLVLRGPHSLALLDARRCRLYRSNQRSGQRH